MNQQQIEEVVKGYLQQAQNGATIENPKFDFKREWYKLGTEEGRNEFVADTSAIANTFGLDGYIVIGYDEKTKTFTNSPFSESGLRDTSDLMNLVNKAVDPIYTINVFAIEYKSNPLTVLHIPPSIAKPHVIRCYKKNGREEQHRIFVRKGAGKQVATRYDIELMYYDRKNLIPDYELFGSFYLESFRMEKHKHFDEGIRYEIKVPLTLENTGRRPVSISKIEFGVTIDKRPNPENILKISRVVLSKPVLIKSGDIARVEIEQHNIVKDIFDLRAVYAENIERYRSDLVATNGAAYTTNGDLINFKINIGKLF